MRELSGRIYLDYAATTPAAPEVKAAMLPYFTDSFANPSAVYQSAAAARAAVDRARGEVASLIHASPSEIYFTSGGTEADNWVLTAICGMQLAERGSCHLIVSSVEHHAVLHTAHYLEEKGVDVTVLPVDREGRVNPADVESAIRPDTALISVMTANNETGTIEPAGEIAEISRARGVRMHTDAVQAFGHIPMDVRSLPVDFLSVSAHKLNGPKGIGCLYIRSGVPIRSFLHGGAQERGRRAGTENVPAAVGFGTAARIAAEKMTERIRSTSSLRDRLERRLLERFPDAAVNGGGADRLPGHLNIRIPGVDAESLLIAMDMHGVEASAGSACAAGSLDPSHVLRAMGLSTEEAMNSIRLTVSHETREEEIDAASDIIAECAARLRNAVF